MNQHDDYDLSSYDRLEAEQMIGTKERTVIDDNEDFYEAHDSEVEDHKPFFAGHDKIAGKRSSRSEQSFGRCSQKVCS